MIQERLQKILRQAGLGSRRNMEIWIKEGLVKVNGKIAQLGDVAGAQDRIHVKGKLIFNPLKSGSKTRILIYHKPVGEISSRSDPEHTKTVFDRLPQLKKSRWIQVGRLDINTSGLLIFTTNGDLAHRLMHPKFGLEREYAVRVHGQVTEEALNNLLKGVELEGHLAQFKKIEFKGGEGSNTWYHVVLTEGRNREVRKLWESQGIVVSRLTRVRYGSITLPRYLPRGQFKEWLPHEVEKYLSTIFNGQKDFEQKDVGRS